MHSIRLLGGEYISFSLAEHLVDTINTSHQEPHESLSGREYQVCIGIASGKSNADMATALNLSENTISTYRARVLEKLNLKNNAELVRYAIDKKLVD